ncbi:MAG TPA: hypothetical protein VL361_03190 [Candidatus Limnocylindrales bacterium]|nr:hypothetical protein [Candidatus Limnocylindrales bacterium]
MCLPALATDWLIDPKRFPAGITQSSDGERLELTNGLVRRVIELRPNAATVTFENAVTAESLLRSVRPEARLAINGKSFDVGGLNGQPIHNYLDPRWLRELTADPAAFHFSGLKIGPTEPRFAWQKRSQWLSTDSLWPPSGASVTLLFSSPQGMPASKVEVHYEIYDGLPLIAKWITVRNDSSVPITLNSMVVEQLAVVEPESIVDGTAANFRSTYRNLQVFSDYAFGGDMNENADAPAVHWQTDPLYQTQVHYQRQTPCLLECAPPLGPDVKISPGEVFESFRVFELVHDNSDRERRGLAVRRAYRTLAPWVQENPILMHVRSAEPGAVKLAIDQCAEVGFEMVILTFGSGFDIENERSEYLKQLKDLANYARDKGIVLGGYSLLASRSINLENDAINPKTGKPGGARFDYSPCLCSRWGLDYFRKLKQFYETTGCGVLEHDGSYPGDVCASTNHPGHAGLEDSQWQQWKLISDFYKWCRARGIYLNVPDWYYLAGSTKCAMGYRESNWSLPREQQEIIERQNICDGTWEKTPSMGWMFVPLTEYQGGGTAATIEPLKDHLPHYEARLANLFGAGVQACYRGPRLFDCDETKAVVKKWVGFYKEHRPILDSEIIHLRRPDARDWDGWLHVNPRLSERALGIFYNPLSEPIERRIRMPLYYTGLTDEAVIRHENGTIETVHLARDYSAEGRIAIPAHGRTWFVIQAPQR